MTAAVLRTPNTQFHHTLPNFNTSMKRTPEPKTPSLANIAPRQRHSLDTSGNSDPSARSHAISRPRLPPRSRFGCWTCRTRKVKCDEARPECTPCARLGHACDYNPRLSFKDDTPRVVNKISGGGGGVGPVWICRCHNLSLHALPYPFLQLLIAPSSAHNLIWTNWLLPQDVNS